MKVTIGDMTFEADENKIATSSRYTEFLEKVIEIEKIRSEAMKDKTEMRNDFLKELEQVLEESTITLASKEKP